MKVSKVLGQCRDHSDLEFFQEVDETKQKNKKSQEVPIKKKKYWNGEYKELSRIFSRFDRY